MGNKILVGSNFTQFKNRILNGDMQVAQRGNVFSIKNDDEFTADRWVSSTADDNELEVRVEDIYSPDEGSMIDATDPFGDGSQVMFYKLEDDATDTMGNAGDIDLAGASLIKGKFNGLVDIQDNNPLWDNAVQYIKDNLGAFSLSMWSRLDGVASEGSYRLFDMYSVWADNSTNVDILSH